MKLLILIGLMLVAKNVNAIYEIGANIEGPHLKILEADKEGMFVSVIFVKLLIKTESELEYIDVYVESITEPKKLTLYGGRLSYTLELPVYVPDVGKPNGKYELIVEGMGLKDSKQIYLKHNGEVNGEFNLKLTDFGEDTTNLSLFNEGETSMFEIWPKGFKASQTERVLVLNGSSVEKHLRFDKTKELTYYGLNLLTNQRKSITNYPEQEEIIDETVEERHWVYESSSKKAGNMALYLFCLVLVVLVLSIQKFK